MSSIESKRIKYFIGDDPSDSKAIEQHLAEIREKIKANRISYILYEHLMDLKKITDCREWDYTSFFLERAAESLIEITLSDQKKVKIDYDNTNKKGAEND